MSVKRLYWLRQYAPTSKPLNERALAVMGAISEREGVSVTQMISRLGLGWSRWSMRRALEQAVSAGLLDSRRRGDKPDRE